MKTETNSIDYSRLTISDVERLVGRKPHDVQVRGSWVVVLFGSSKDLDNDGTPAMGSGLSFRFKKW